ncbi:phage integrase SAM-like domain-containing protein [Flavobacterium limi]|uniref:Phage integrase SAM-like domain-containing protein n=1 Tax=Flavobacterium limi TaxID=2045105 RepID=A0ABQ1UZ99_9FLAO|nr:phage integrase SAM-like domain-containing protein [Flavobacterium limi]GGF30063.1 hypothetical protein GCM10011518_44140 [Flavobacterium limi]
MSFKIVLNRKNKSDSYGILGIQDISNNVKFKKSLNIKVSVEDFKHFNKDTNQFSKDLSNYKDLNSKIFSEIIKSNYKKKETVKFKKNKAKQVTLSIPSDSNDIISDSDSDSDPDFIDYFKQRIQAKRTFSHRESCNNVRNKFERFLKYEGKETVKFSEITPTLIEAFYNFCIDIPDPNRTMTVNGFKNYLKILKKVVSDAETSGFYNLPRDPFSLIKGLVRDPTDKKGLSADQFQRLLKLDLYDSKLILARDIFSFALLSNGMRFNDAIFIRYGMFKNCLFSYKMSKTKYESSIQISFKMALKLLEIIAIDGGKNIYEDYLNKQSWEGISLIPGEKNQKLTYQQICNIIELNSLKINELREEDLERDELIEYKGYIFSKYKSIQHYIDAKENLIYQANDELIIYVQNLIDKKNPNDFIFLDRFNKNQVKYFKHYNAKRIMTEIETKKYRGLRNDYNLRLKKIENIYNDSLPQHIEKHKNVIKLSAHISRHSFAKILVDANINVYLISHALVHRNLSTTQKLHRKIF